MCLFLTWERFSLNEIMNVLLSLTDSARLLQSIILNVMCLFYYVWSNLLTKFSFSLNVGENPGFWARSSSSGVHAESAGTSQHIFIVFKQ